MDHHHTYMHQPNPPLHWGYASAPPSSHHPNNWISSPHNNTAIIPSRSSNTSSSKGIKHTISESDCDDAYSETSSTRDHNSPKTNAINGRHADNCQHLSRKKRRGVIEKKRRDRINLSLSELKRLVPTAFEKQGSAKLEKAEILQLTVDHLKMLQAKGVDSSSYDPQRFAIDYHIIGFRDCVTEVGRYLVNSEGMDIQDPLRLRLISHLQCFATQREISLSSKSSVFPITPSNWCHSSSSPLQPTYNPGYHPNYSMSNVYVSAQAVPVSSTSTVSTDQSHSSRSHPSISIASSPPDHQQTRNLHVSDINNHSQPNQSQEHASLHHSTQPQQHYQTHTDPHGSTYTDLSTSVQRHSSTVEYAQFSPGRAQEYIPISYNTNGTKPYRPWGAEMAY